MAIWQENDKKPTICGMKNVLFFNSSTVSQPYWLPGCQLAACGIYVRTAVPSNSDIYAEVFKLLSK
jgi:hypothetical protein